MRILPRNAWAALPLVWLGFMLFSAALSAGSRRLSAASAPAWRAQAALSIGLSALSLAAAAVEGVGPRGLGFCWPAAGRWGAAIAGGLVLGALATLTISISGARGLRPVLGGYSFGAILLWVFVASSVSEEIFCRGWFQTSTTPSDAGLLALAPSALLFAGMHLSLLRTRVDLASTAIVVAATAVLGLLAAWARARSGSLYPAIAAHAAFNLGGAACGVAYMIVRQVLTHDRGPQELDHPPARPARP